MTDILSAVKNRENNIITKNFGMMLHYNGKSFIFKIIERLEVIKNTASVDDLNNNPFEFKGPKSPNLQFEAYVSQRDNDKVTISYINNDTGETIKKTVPVNKYLSDTDLIRLNYPKLHEDIIVNVDGIYHYLDSLYSQIYAKYLSGTFDISDEFEEKVISEIEKVKNNILENTIVQRTLIKYLDQVEVL